MWCIEQLHRADAPAMHANALWGTPVELRRCTKQFHCKALNNKAPNPLKDAPSDKGGENSKYIYSASTLKKTGIKI